MKKILFLICLAALTWSCSSDNEQKPSDDITNEPTGEAKEYIVSLGMIGEILDIEESPLTKASGNDLYGIQVYSKTSTTEYAPYAYGLFDDKSKMTIKLLEGYVYKFVSTMIVDGKNKIYKGSYGYTIPFTRDVTNETKLENIFVYNNSTRMKWLDHGAAFLRKESNHESYDIAPIERFYGEVENFTPSKNATISINMKRVCFGVKFIAEGLTEGKLMINIKQAPELNISYGQTEVQSIFNFYNTYPNGLTWTKDDYSETIPVSISWEKADGAIIPLINKDITFKRNILTTITIKVKDTAVNNGIDISQETEEMKKGEDITLESGTGLDGNVDPSK